MLRLFVVYATVILLAADPCDSQKNSSTIPLRVAVVGLVHGHVEGFFQHNLHRPDIQIVGISDPSEDLFKRYARQFSLNHKLYYADLDDMLEKTHPQAVLVYTSTYDHRAVVETCARHRVHVMMEKPLAASYADALSIAAAAQHGNIHILVNYETTWYRSNHAAFDLVREGTLGDIRKIVVHDGHRGPKEIGVQPEFLAWLTDPKLNGAGALFDFGCYGADLSTWLMNGQPPLSVTAVTQTIKPVTYPKVDDEAVIVLKYPKAVAIIQASWNWPFDRKDMEVYGQKGYVITVARDDIRVRKADEEEQTLKAKDVTAPYDDPLTELRAVIRDGAQPDGPTSLATNLIAMEILDAARTSAATGKTVTLPLGR
ncbi:MAG TPA: Gfo/Idh/MocA family oxidoreductase [Candidatus Eisenbacteria bacterium]|nr:Gfo/Idh/MocA family oxidoreductase [Candidatus Eisenbacteria bacterium]